MAETGAEQQGPEFGHGIDLAAGAGPVDQGLSHRGRDVSLAPGSPGAAVDAGDLLGRRKKR